MIRRHKAIANFLVLVCFCIPFFIAVPIANADVIPSDVNAEWQALNDVQLESWVTDGAMTADETVAVADVVAGVAGIAAIGPVALVAGGVIVIDAVWKSGLGSSLGHWLFNATNGYSGTRVTNEDWCPFVHGTWGGPYGVQTVTPPTPSCGSNAAADYEVAQGAQLPAYGDQTLHLVDKHVDHLGTPVHVGFDSDIHNYFTMDFHGSGCTDINNTGMFGATGRFDFSMFADSNPTMWTGTHSGHQWDCMSDAWDDSAAYAGDLVSVANNGCVIDVPTGSPPCGTGGKTCAQEIMVELSTSVNGGTTYSGACYFIAITEEQMAEMLGGTSLKPCGGSGQVACPTVGVVTIGSNTGTTNCGGQSPCRAALDKLDTETGICTYESQFSCGTPNTSHVRDKVGCHLYGTNCSSDKNLTIPRPQLTETYDQYIARLRALGFWGFISVLEDDMDYPVTSPAYQLIPGLMTEIMIGTDTPIPIYWPTPGHGLSGSPSSAPNAGKYSKWPGSPTNVPPGTTITILKVPETYVPGGPSGGGGGPCNCPGINFSPLTSMDYGDKFPFGVFSMLGTVSGSFAGAGDGTPVAIHLHLFGHPKTYSLASSKWEDEYRPIVFPILEFLMTLAGVAWFALRVLGHPGGEAEGTD